MKTVLPVPRRDTGMGRTRACLTVGALCMRQCSRGETEKLMAGEQQLPTSSVPNWARMFPLTSHLVGQTESVCIWNTNLIWNLEMPQEAHPRMCELENLQAVHQRLSFYRWERVSQLLFPSAVPTSSQARRSQTLALLASFSQSALKFPSRNLSSRSPPSCPTRTLV